MSAILTHRWPLNRRRFLRGLGATIALLEPGREFKVLAAHALPELVRSTPVWSSSRLQVRGLENLWCLREE